MKILSPAGNFESLKAAVYNGADEVYLGINSFNARNNINGFDLDNLNEAVDFAHIYNVKVLLAINILFSDAELQSALNTVIDAYNMGVDAFIVQDLGLAKLISENYSQIELHASTQMGISSLEGVKQLEKFGFKRVVLARETPLSEIKRIKQNSSIEIEYFAQGALCVSFSGNCYLSSYLYGASGNRGKCKQLCRLPYTLQQNGKNIKSGYLLSTKDFNMINKLDDLKSAGVDVIKIEGRARRPFYVAMATKQYYNAINKLSVNEEELKLAFNREYIQGYFNGNDNIISDYNNHIGVKIGKVEKFVKGKKFNEVFIVSNKVINPKSTLKMFNNKKETNTLTAYDVKQTAKNKYVITTTQIINVGDDVHLIIDNELENGLLSNIKKQKLKLQIIAQINKPIKAIVNVGNNEVVVLGEVCQAAIKQPLSENDIIENFKKSELFDADIEFVSFNNVFLTKSQLNEFRRNVFEKVVNFIINTHKNNENKIKININYKIKKFKDFKIVEKLSEDFGNQNIIYSPEVYELNDIKAFIKKCKSLNKNAYLDTPNFALEKDIDLLKNIIDVTNIPIIANNYYALSFNTQKVIGAALNVYNTVTAGVFDLPVITAESNISTKINFPYMTLRHCPIKSHLNCDCSNCKFSNNLTYKMDNGKVFKLKRKKLTTCTFYLTD